MLTIPCGHQVVCRKCFVKTIKNAVAQRLLPLRCVICRSKVIRLKSGDIPNSASGYSMDSATSSVPQSDSLYSVSSGESSISSTSCSSDIVKGPPCCGGHCSGAYPRQPATGAIKRSQQHAMKMKIQDYCRPDKNHVNRLPPIKELPGQSPLHTAPPASTRIRCAQKIITQLEFPILRQKGHKYEKLAQEDDDENVVKTDKSPDKEKHWWSDKKRDRTKSEEKIDNKKNEIVEKQMELKEKLVAKADIINENNERNIIEHQL
nr:uncharacterized protein LOC111515532 [Leptinotarsa decemlineata]